MVNTVHLRTMLEVTRRGSFAAAAGQLGYTASAVSQQMSALERETGVKLFERSARSVQPTEAAQIMSRHAAKVLTDIEALLAATAGSHDASAQEIKLGIFPSLATYVLPRLLSASDWSGLGIKLKVYVAEPGQTIQGLRSGGGLDVALVFQVGQGGLAWPHNISRQWLGDDNYRVVLPQSWGIRHGATVTASQLAEMPWIMHHPGTSDATVIERLFASCDLHPRVAAYCDDFNASLAMAASGLGAALVPELALQDGPDGIVVIDVPEVRLARNIFALLLNDRQNPRLDVFMDRLSGILHESSIARKRP